MPTLSCADKTIAAPHAVDTPTRSVVGVALWAVGLHAAVDSSIAPRDVLLMGNRLKVCRFNAPRVAATMVNFQSLWDGAICFLVAILVSTNRATVQVKTAIATRILICSPFPASVSLINLLPKPLCDCFSHENNRLTPTTAVTR